MLIKSYGLYWNPDIIDWGSVGAGNNGELTGVIKRKKKSHEINFWEARGIYVQISSPFMSERHTALPSENVFVTT